MQQTYNGPNYHISSVQTILTPDQAALKQSSRIQLLQIGSSTTESRSLSRPTTSEYLGVTDFEWPCCQMHQMWSSCCLQPTSSLIIIKEEITRYADGIVSTCSPAVLPDGSNIDDAPGPKTDPHCNKVYGDIQDFDKDLADLVAVCRRNTRCSAAYCLHTQNG